jgi:hypothetical protein
LRFIGGWGFGCSFYREIIGRKAEITRLDTAFAITLADATHGLPLLLLVIHLISPCLSRLFTNAASL